MNRGDHLDVIFRHDKDRELFLATLSEAVHLNPVRAGLVHPEQPLQTYRWSSYRLYLNPPQLLPFWLRMDRLLGEWGIPADSAAGREQFALYMEARRKAEQTGDSAAFPHGWSQGREEFRQELLLQMTTLATPKFAGPEWRETSEKKAECILTEELARRGWEPQRLEQLRKADPEKLKIAGRLRAQTSVSLKWIAQHLNMGAPAYLGNCLRIAKR